MTAAKRRVVSSAHAPPITPAGEMVVMGMPAQQTKRWTLAELHRLPEDDGNTYEVVHGELFVTPPPTVDHETVAARLVRVLDPYVERHGRWPLTRWSRRE
jgi:Uma2 family endonuclease